MGSGSCLQIDLRIKAKNQKGVKKRRIRASLSSTRYCKFLYKAKKA